MGEAEIALLGPLATDQGLPLAHRACPPAARRLKLPINTAEHDWADLDLGVTVELIR